MYVATTIAKNGFFFTPQSPEKRYPGTLTISDGGRIELEITADEPAFTSYDEMMIGRLIGQVEGGYVTLEGCEYRTMNLSFAGMTGKSLITARLVFVGLGLPESAKFTSLRFCVDGLNEWLGRSAFEVGIGQSFEDWTVTMKRPEPVQCTLPDDTMLEIDIEVKLPGAIKYPTLELYQQAFIQITPAEPQPFEFYQKLSHRITRFFSFAIGRPVAIHSLKAKIDDPEISDVHKWLELYFQSLNNSAKQSLSSRDMLLGYSSIALRFGDLLSTWLNEYENLMPALHHYFSVQDESLAYLDTKFIAMAQALEAFHRRTSGSGRWPKDEYKAKVAAIIEGCPEEDRQWLQQKLNFGNEITLAERLHQLIDRFAGVFGGETPIDLIVRDTVRTRNYHAHYDPQGAAKALKGGALISLTFRLRVLFALCLLIRLGLTEEEAIDLARSAPLQRLLRNANYIEQNGN